MTIVIRAALAAAVVAFASSAVLAQDAVKVDPKHYTVLIDNPQVRVLRIHYGPHETSVRHSHPDSVVTYLTNGRMKMLLGNGKTVVSSGKAGESVWTPAGVHTPTNLGDTPFEAVLVEMKRPAVRPGK